MDIRDLLQRYLTSPVVKKLVSDSQGKGKYRLIRNAGSVTPVILNAVADERPGFRVIVLDDREEAAYFYNDVLTFAGEKKVGFLPSSYRRAIRSDEKDNDSVLVRTEVLDGIVNGEVRILVTYPEALAERVVAKDVLANMSMMVHKGDKLSISFLENLLVEYGFERSDFVYEPGQFSIRGSIVDVYSYAEERPVRIDFFGDEVESIRFFDVETQLSELVMDSVSLVPDLSNLSGEYAYADLFAYFAEEPRWWVKNGLFLRDRIKTLRQEAPENVFTEENALFDYMERCGVVEWGPDVYFRGETVDVGCEAQPVVNKKFEMLAEVLQAKQGAGYDVFVCSTNGMQLRRLQDIFSDKGYRVPFTPLEGVLHEGFTDERVQVCVYTEHQIFDRYHKYRLQTTRIRKGRESITLSELQNLHPGDYVVHVDHGIGRFGGLVKIDNNGKVQEAIRLVYKNNSELYVGLHSLHKISKYKGKDGVPPTVNKLGGEAWNRMKQKTKSRVKDIARELIALYAKRKEEPAFAFSKDSYLQEEMEASFMYEETVDQMKAIEAVKSDMEHPIVMDRLVCGDVGFGKTEVAIRAAFKAVADSKQVAVLVPTTILAYQHYNTFMKRLEGMPCRVEYISRMKKSGEIKKILSDLKEGKVDIIIGTHRLTSKDVVFKDLGLLIVDEEQKFGVGVKEKLKRLKVNVDTITMTATPIPRTLQFSLMGARDMSIIRTPPPNRYPIVTELHRFDEKVIKEALLYEIARGGQVFFIHNRVETIRDIQDMLHRIVPQLKCCIAHGQMPGEELEKVMHDFIRGDYDVLIATTIIESGLDIPNANTMIVNQAQNYGLSDLHQLRGRVGRSNKKAFCYLLTPSLELVNPDARRRLKAIEDFSGLGSGFNIAMQDLDIRGAGNILGAEQSGFISEIGYETYQRILNEALLELRDEEFPDLQVMEEHGGGKDFVAECVVESDFEVLIPEFYVENVSERVRLYRELDNVSTEEELDIFGKKLQDRFGELPPQVTGLMQIVRVRRWCMALGVERLLVKNGKMVMYFVYSQTSPFYSSAVFSNLLRFVQHQELPCRMSEKNEKLSLVFTEMTNIEKVVRFVGKMWREIVGIGNE
ncbi:transcription-repair coupling factor [Odoribacter lunatus]|uniref:transcription-repair coupling factor n=1 Tax=Odoribacter lunatus TaxID=2941335 RepID=UPI003B973D74